MADEAKEEQPIYQTAAQLAGQDGTETGTRTPGLSYSPNLSELPDSKVPGLGNGGMISHVHGPQQAPADPIAAGLDTGFNPATTNSNRLVNQTGALAAGPGPATYAEKPGGELVQQRTEANQELVPVPDRPHVIQPEPGTTAEPATPIPEPETAGATTPLHPAAATAARPIEG